MPHYDITYEPLFGPLQRMDVTALIAAAPDTWYNQTLIQVGDVVVRLGVIEGEFHWHHHDDEDELFYVVDGRLRIELEGREPVELEPGAAFCVPAGLRHRTVAPSRTAVLMLAKAGVVATGD